MRVLVTGGAGFIGSHIAELLVNKGYEVVILDDFSKGKKENIKNLDVEVIKGDIRNFKLVKEACKNVDFISHQAAVRLVAESVKKATFYNGVNINGTYNVLEAAKLNSVKRVVFASSCSVYGDNYSLPQREGKEGNRLSPYAITKYTGEDYCKYYYKEYELETVCLRYFNVFGPRQDVASQYSAVIPLFIQAISKSRKPVIYGDGEQTRDFIYVSDVASANLLAFKAKASGESINIGSGLSVSVNSLVSKINKILYKNIEPKHVESRKGEVRHALADTSNAKKLLDFKPSFSFEKGLEETTNWFENQTTS